jgi:photosystem II stability/assembly factor-like uncharacterized protein
MMLIGTDGGIYRWFEGGPWPVFHGLQGKSIASLASPGAGVIVAADDAGRIWETTNNGLDWREVPRPDGAKRPSALAVWGTPADIVMAAKPLGLYRRPIGAPVGPPPPRLSEMPALFWKRARRGRNQGGVATAAVSSEPDLAGWTPLNVPEVAQGAAPPAIRVLVIGHCESAPWFAAVSGAGVWKSRDLGATWRSCNGLPNDVYALRAGPKGLVVAGTSDGCWISSDSGETWTDKSGGLEKSRQIRAIEVKPGNPNVMLAGAAPQGDGEGPVASRSGLRFALYETKDGGKTWSHVARGFPELLESDQITDIRYNPADTNYAVATLASGEMWATATDGLWWEPLARQIRAARVLCATV